MTQPELALPLEAKLWDRTSVIAAAILIAVAGSYAMSVLPLFVGSLAQGLGLNDQQMGVLASADLAGMALSSGSAVFWARRVNWRIASVAAFVLMLAANLLAMHTVDYAQIVLLRALSGFGGGMAVAIGLSCQGDSSKADKLFGLFIASQVLCALLSFLLMPRLMETYGINGVLGLIVAVAACGLLGALFMPAGGKPRALKAAKGGVGDSSFAGLLALLGLFLFCVSLGGTWAYVQRLGEMAGLTAALVGQTLGAAAIIGLVCALSAAMVSKKLGRSLTLLLIAVADGVAMTAFNLADSHLEFFVALGFFQLAWMIGIPVILGLINSLDVSGRMIVISLLAIKVGYAIAPVLMSRLIGDGSYLWMLMCAGILCLFGCALCYQAGRQHESLT